MCGIAGFCGETKDNLASIKKMCDAMIYRGPNAQGFWQDTNASVTMGHRRLSVLDLSENGSQPMISASGRYVIAYNGEIYNFQEIQKKLMSDGQITKFRSSSDTETILEAFEAYGLNAISLAKGMFAIALYDRKEKALHLLRDRSGEKPLYYGIVGDKFAFASELSVLKQLDGFVDEIDRNALQAYTQYKSVPQPLSIYKNIYKLLPGYVLTIKTPFKKAEFSQYWSFEDVIQNGLQHPFQGSFVEAVDTLDKLLTDSVRGQMISDVPLGAFLSAGIDSPLIVSMMQKLSSKPVNTYTIGFYDELCNEAVQAKDIAKHLGTNHTELYINEQDLLSVVPMLPSILSEPLADPACLPNFLVSKLAKKEVTVTLSGDGGDELFCGYDIYNRLSRIHHSFSQFPYPLRRISGGILQSFPFANIPKLYNLGEFCKSTDLLDFHELFRKEHSLNAHTVVIPDHDTTHNYIDSFLQRLEPDLLPDLRNYRKDSILNSLDERSTLLFRDQTGFMTDTVLSKVDRTGMYVSLENRIPLLDKDIIEFSWSIPINYKSENNVNKRILRELLYRYVPKSLVDRPKHGFEVPLTQWLSGPLFGWAEDLIHNNSLAESGYYNKTVLQKIWKDFCARKSNTLLLWYILQAEAWYQNSKK